MQKLHSVKDIWSTWQRNTWRNSCLEITFTLLHLTRPLTNFDILTSKATKKNNNRFLKQLFMNMTWQDKTSYCNNRICLCSGMNVFVLGEAHGENAVLSSFLLYNRTERETFYDRLWYNMDKDDSSMIDCKLIISKLLLLLFLLK